MAIIKELIRQEASGKLSFGDYLSETKQKLKDFDICGDLYSVKTYNEVTRLEKNGSLFFESVPGSTVTEFNINSKKVDFYIESNAEDVQITVDLGAEVEYKIYIDDVQAGKGKTNLAGKLTASVETKKDPKHVVIEIL